MNPIRQILFATDLSPASETAAHTALEFARRFGATLHLLHVVLPGTATETPPLLGTLADEFKRSVPVTSAVESGNPATQIVRYAEQEHIDLIVIGTHGRTGMTRVPDRWPSREKLARSRALGASSARVPPRISSASRVALGSAGRWSSGSRRKSAPVARDAERLFPYDAGGRTRRARRPALAKSRRWFHGGRAAIVMPGTASHRRSP
jgi:hypothetical protein